MEPVVLCMDFSESGNGVGHDFKSKGKGFGFACQPPLGKVSILSGDGENVCIVELYQIQVVLVASALCPHALLLDKCEEVVMFHEHPEKWN